MRIMMREGIESKDPPEHEVVFIMPNHGYRIMMMMMMRVLMGEG